MKLAEEFLKEKLRRGWSASAAAKELGISSGTYEGWEKGWREPGRDHWEAIARYLNVPMPVLLGWLGLLTDEQVKKLSDKVR